MTPEEYARVRELARKILRAGLRPVEGVIADLNGRLEAAYLDAASRLTEELRGVVSRRDAERIARDALADVERDISQRVARAIGSASTHGVAAAAETAAATFGHDVIARASKTLDFVIPTDADAMTWAGQRVRGELAIDRIPLSARLHRVHAEVAKDLARTVQASARAGESITTTAERILDAHTDLRVELPQYVRDLADAARDARLAGDGVYKEAVDLWRAQIDRLGQSTGPSGAFTIRNATESLVEKLGKGKIGDEAISKAVERWVVDKAQYRARQIARSETREAYRTAYLRSTERAPWTIGYQWEVSGGHRRADICDVLEAQDLFGLGPGVYPAGQVPVTPHPNDRCALFTVIDTSYQRRLAAQRRGLPEPPRPWESGQRVTGEEWVLSQPAAYQRELLGPTRYAMLHDPKAPRPIRADGSIAPVHELLGTTPRPRNVELAPTRSAIERDRARMVRQRATL